MAVVNRMSVSPRQARAAEQAAGFEAEQRRLKADAARRRAAAAVSGDDTADGSSRPGAARGSRYLR